MMTHSTDQTAAELAEQIRWQRQAAALLGKFLELAAKNNLPPINWMVQSAGASLVGEVLSHPDTQRRERFDAWKAAIAAASGRTPDQDTEHSLGTSGAETRLTVAWERLPVTLTDDGKLRPGARVALVASIWPDDPDEARGDETGTEFDPALAEPEYGEG
jgi:hypothetical protein